MLPATPRHEQLLRRLRVIAPALPVDPPAAAPIEIVVTGVRNARGHVRVDICPEDRFLHDCTLSGEAAAHAGTVTVLVRGVPPGRYAVQSFHDENDNGKVDRSLFGLPREGVGFSNDAKIRMGPPKFAEAAFVHAAAGQRLTLTMRYF